MREGIFRGLRLVMRRLLATDFRVLPDGMAGQIRNTSPAASTIPAERAEQF